MKERVHLFGSHGGLVGVRCDQVEGPRPGHPFVLFANVGLNHRVGPNRIWVDLARRLARAGFSSLRFDLSGRGDSEARSDARSDRERGVLDTVEAMDFLGSRGGGERFVIVANCSGVDSLHATALSDRRVVGAVAIDGYAYRNFGYWLRRRTICLLQPSRFKRWLRRSQAEKQGRRRGAGEAQEVWVRDIPTQAAFASALGEFQSRGVRLLLVFTGGADQAYNHQGQFEESFGPRAGVEVDFYPRSDHLFSAVSDRRWLVERVLAFMNSHYGPGKPVQPEALHPA